MSNQAEIIVTVDYEERYHGLNSIDPRNFSDYKNHLPRVTPNLLDLLSNTDTSATFFVTGHVTETNPSLVETIAAAGHEIGAHGWLHQPVYEMSLDEFRGDVKKCLNRLDELTQEPIRGYRAPYFSLPFDRAEEYLRILKSEGYRYDSSLTRFTAGFAGDPEAPNVPITINGFTEVPMSTVKFCGYYWPVTGGFVFRLLPYSIIRRTIKTYLEHHEAPIVLYLHPWALESIDWGLWWSTHLREKITHFWGRTSFRTKLEKLFSEFSTTSMESYLNESG